MKTNEIWLFTDDQHFSQDEKNKLAGIQAGAQPNPTKLSELANDIGFVTNAVNNLTNYYLKTETYTKNEVQSLVGAITTMNVLVVDTLPTENISTKTIYLVAKDTAQTNNVHDEYVYVNGAFEKIGDTEIDLTNYALKSEIPTKTSELTNDSGFLTAIPSEYVTEAELNAKGYLTEHQDLSAYALKTEIPNVPTVVTKIW